MGRILFSVQDAALGNGRDLEPPLDVHVVCAVCGTELGCNDKVFTWGKGDFVAGCSHCIRTQNAAEWLDIA